MIESTVGEFRCVIGLSERGGDTPNVREIWRFDLFIGETWSCRGSKSDAAFSAKLDSDLCTLVSNDRTRGNTPVSDPNIGTAHHDRCKNPVRRIAGEFTFCAVTRRAGSCLRASCRESVFREAARAGRGAGSSERRQLSELKITSDVERTSFACRERGAYQLRRES